MTELTTNDVRSWDLSVIHQLFQAAQGLDKAHQKFGDSLDHVNTSTKWHGAAGDAFRAELHKPRTDLDKDGKEAQGVAKALENAENDVRYCKSQLSDLDERAHGNGWTITSDWRVDTTNETDTGRKHDPQLLQNDVDQLKTRAHAADHELATAVRAAVGDAQVDDSGHEVGGQPGSEAGKTTPADQLPLPPGAGIPTPTEASRDNSSPDPGKHLNDNPRPSPLLAGLSAEEWRHRLEHFQPGDPLPDPRTPTGDKAIDALAHAAGQQNTSYAWGGNQSTNGPSRGHKATSQEYPNYTQQQLERDGSWTSRDDERVGYDCGGLVRYAYQQGASVDVGQGTYNIDRNSQLTQAAGGIPGAAVAGQAHAGDILVFGASTPFTGGGTHHTGLYIGNGYMINAPDSGNPIRVDRVDGHGMTDVLRLP